MLLKLTENDFFLFLREACCGLEYAENAFAFAAGVSPGSHWGSSLHSPRPLVGWGGDTPLGALGVSTLGSAAPRTHNFWLRHCVYGRWVRTEFRDSVGDPS